MKLNITFFSLIVFGLCFFSCNKKNIHVQNPSVTTPIIVELNQEIILKDKETAILSSKDFKVEVLSIKDSRCPVGMNCIRAGEVQFLLRLHHEVKSLDTVLSYPSRGQSLKSIEKFAGYQIELTAANQKNDKKLDPAHLGGIFIIKSLN